jgi:hypothetical protein
VVEIEVYIHVRDYGIGITERNRCPREIILCRHYKAVDDCAASGESTFGAPSRLRVGPANAGLRAR